MRQITKEAIKALMTNRSYKKDNTEVRDKAMFLHQYKVAWVNDNNHLFICACGFLTNTTKERLNGLPNVNIVQKRGDWYLNGVYWDGMPKHIGRVDWYDMEGM